MEAPDSFPHSEQLFLKQRLIKFGHEVLGNLLRDNQYWSGTPNAYEERRAGIQQLKDIANGQTGDTTQ